MPEKVRFTERRNTVKSDSKDSVPMLSYFMAVYLIIVGILEFVY